MPCVKQRKSLVFMRVLVVGEASATTGIAFVTDGVNNLVGD